LRAYWKRGDQANSEVKNGRDLLDPFGNSIVFMFVVVGFPAAIFFVSSLTS